MHACATAFEAERCNGRRSRLRLLLLWQGGGGNTDASGNTENGAEARRRRGRRCGRRVGTEWKGINQRAPLDDFCFIHEGDSKSPPLLLLLSCTCWRWPRGRSWR